MGQPATIIGTPGDDFIEGTPGPDVIDGLTGVDHIRALDGDDIVCVTGGQWGEPGDRVMAAGGNDMIRDRHAAGEDLGSPQLLRGGAGDDIIWGGQFPTIYGGPGDDVIRGDWPTSWGGRGDDHLIRGVVHPGPGRDIVHGRGQAELVYTDSKRPVIVDLRNHLAHAEGLDTIYGIEFVFGSPFDDELRGGPKADYLDGGQGNDVYRGRGGNDYLWERLQASYGRHDIGYGGRGIGATCLGIEERHNCPIWND